MTTGVVVKRWDKNKPQSDAKVAHRAPKEGRVRLPAARRGVACHDDDLRTFPDICYHRRLQGN